MVELQPPPGGRDRQIRLEVPPTSAPEPAAAERRGVQWTAAVALVGIVGLAVALFVVLPRMVETRQPAYRGASPADRPAPPEPSEPPRPALTPNVPSEKEKEPEAVARERDEPAREPEVRATERREPVRETEKKEPPRNPFVEAMSQGLAALDRDDYAAARDAFLEARKLHPGSPESADGLSRAEAGLRRLEIAALQERAQAAEAAEDWHAAVQAYEAVLKIDPSVGFALEGADRARRRADLDDRLRYHLANQGRLASAEVLDEAARLLRQASEASAAGGARLQHQVEELGGLVESYSRPVRVELRSDNLTEVTVYRVGRLGTFEERDLSLRPGTYTVVGSRDGYRDVRRQLVVEPGQEPEPLWVRCEEKI